MSSIGQAGKKYGLSLAKKASTVSSQSRSNIFGNDSDEDSGGGSNKNMIPAPRVSINAKLKKQTQLDIDRALAEDPTVYEYDAVYDDMQAEKSENADIKAAKKHDRKENLFTKCTICVLLERKLQQKHSPKTRMEIMLQKQRHLRRQMVEKLAYYRRREAAKRRPDRFMSLIVDGMDQAKTYIPHFVGRLSKEIAASIMLKLHVTGVICHGHNLRFTYTDYHQYKHDSNLTMNVLLKVLWEVAKHKSLPPVLYLQADNCFRENKNKYVLGFLELLVRKDIFYEVQMSFLKVGHTHEDVDQMFSTIARTLRTEEASTYPKMLLRLPNGKELRGCFNISKWLEPHLILPHHHTRTSTFRLRKQNDDVDVFYRKNEGQKWRVLKGGFFRKIDNQTSIPSDKPDILIPSLETLDVDGLTQSIDKWAKYFNNSEEIWWQNFVRQLTQIQNNQTTAKQWGRQDAIWYLDDLKKYSLRALEEYEQGPVVGQEIINLLENEEDNPEPKYIEGLLKATQKRKLEEERRTERTVQKEREAEGDEFADKEAFVTSAYKKRMLELQAEEENERREAEREAKMDVTKQKDMTGFYRYILDETTNVKTEVSRNDANANSALKQENSMRSHDHSDSDSGSKNADSDSNNSSSDSANRVEKTNKVTSPPSSKSRERNTRHISNATRSGHDKDSQSRNKHKSKSSNHRLRSSSAESDHSTASSPERSGMDKDKSSKNQSRLHSAESRDKHSSDSHQIKRDRAGSSSPEDYRQRQRHSKTSPSKHYSRDDNHKRRRSPSPKRTHHRRIQSRSPSETYRSKSPRKNDKKQRSPVSESRSKSSHNSRKRSRSRSPKRNKRVHSESTSPDRNYQKSDMKASSKLQAQKSDMNASSKPQARVSSSDKAQASVSSSDRPESSVDNNKKDSSEHKDGESRYARKTTQAEIQAARSRYLARKLAQEKAKS